MAARRGTVTDHAVAARQPWASGGGRGSGGLSESGGGGGSVQRTEKSCGGNVKNNYRLTLSHLSRTWTLSLSCLIQVCLSVKP